MSKPKDEIRPFIRIYTKYRRILINLAVHDILGKPPCLEFYWNEEKKLLLIAPYWDIKMGCYQIPARIYHSRRSEMIVEENAFVRGLMNKLSWQNNVVYKVYRDFISKINMIGFSLANPIIKEIVKR